MDDLSLVCHKFKSTNDYSYLGVDIPNSFLGLIEILMVWTLESFIIEHFNYPTLAEENLSIFILQRYGSLSFMVESTF